MQKLQEKIDRNGSEMSSVFVSWTDIFPVLDDDMLEVYEAGLTREEEEEFEEWFGVARIVSPACGRNSGKEAGRGVSGEKKEMRHIVSATLFWKHVKETDPDLPLPSREMLVDAQRMGLVKRFAPWESYIDPLFLHSQEAVERHPEVTFRLYLAADLQFLIPDLSELGWEVHLMKSPSIRYCPGGFWRFLALEEEGAFVTVIDTDRMNEVSYEIERTETIAEMGLGFWRVPGYYNSDLSRQVRYRPILGGHFGARGGIPVRKLIEAFVWHWRNGSLPQTAMIPGIGKRPIQSAKWPDYGFDEWFQLVAMYPRLVHEGTLTFIPSDARSLLLPVDIEYCMWANPRSESAYF